MTDGTHWTPPDASPAGPAPTPWSAPAPPLGPPSSTMPPFPASAGGSASPAVPLGAGTGWTPPPKPGLVPLRPMTLGTILSAMLQVMRRNPLPTFGLALLLSLASSVITVGLLALAFVPFGASGLSGDGSAILGAVLLALLGGVVGVVGQLLVASIVQGVVTLEVASGTLGERMRLGGLWRRLRPRLPRVVGWLLLVSAASAVALGLLIAIVAGIASIGDAASTIAAVLVAIVGGLGLAVLAIWIGFKLVFVVPGIVLERRGVFASMARSWRLTRGYFWRTFGIVLLVYVIYTVAGSIVSIPVQIIVSIGGALLGTGLDESAGFASVVVIYGVTLVVGWLIGAVGMVMLSATVALLHIDTRMRKEGLDQELVRAAEARAAGTAFVDPYAAPAAAATAPPDSPWA